MSITSFSSSATKITQSRFLLAKYRIQVIDPEKIEQPVKVVEEEQHLEELQQLHHHHTDNTALECKKIGTERSLDIDSCIQWLWCCCLPFIFLNELIFGCANHCCNLAAEITTNLEESHTMTGCFSCDCCKLSI